MTLSEDAFDATYKPINASDSESIWEYGQTLAHPIQHVWTIVDADDDNLYALAGYHVVNRVGYIVTEVPWEHGDEEGVWFAATE